MANPMAGGAAMGRTDPGNPQLIKRITSMAFTSPSNKEPVSPINIRAGEWLKIRKPNNASAQGKCE